MDNQAKQRRPQTAVAGDTNIYLLELMEEQVRMQIRRQRNQYQPRQVCNLQGHLQDVEKCLPKYQLACKLDSIDPNKREMCSQH